MIKRAVAERRQIDLQICVHSLEMNLQAGDRPIFCADGPDHVAFHDAGKKERLRDRAVRIFADEPFLNLVDDILTQRI